MVGGHCISVKKKKGGHVSLCCSDLLSSQRQVAMISEMIHNASLVHDDVIDQPDFRRGKPSVNVVWSQKKVSFTYRSKSEENPRFGESHIRLTH